MSQRVIIVVTHGPDTPAMCASPFFFAESAAAMGCSVQMHFTSQATALLEKGVADVTFPKKGGRSVREMLIEAAGLGVQMMVCTASLELNDMTENDLVDEVENLVGGAYLIDQGLAADLVLTF
jgi:predicted peroxiredoxin